MSIDQVSQQNRPKDKIIPKNETISIKLLCVFTQQIDCFMQAYKAAI